jgi:hypothetical protein
VVNRRRIVSLSALAFAFVALSGASCSPADDAGRAADDAARAGDDAGRIRVPPVSAEDVGRVLSAEAIRAAKALLQIPEPTDFSGSRIQLSTIKSSVKGAACDYLYKWVTGGTRPQDTVFFTSLGASLDQFGSLTQNQANAIGGSFGKLRDAVHGTTDAQEAAKAIACAVVGLG